MPAPTPLSAFMSLAPIEPVLVFGSSTDAESFQSRCRQGRIVAAQSGRWVYLPLPAGLQRVRTARGGDVAFEFDSHRNAAAWNLSIGEIGKIYASTKEKPRFDTSVYLGKVWK
ncbi:uncharacterized protein BDZ99DRAFT_383847 [Mytilinidion resinicola]|uniref:Uncharacterized protein n=1 Tax=Mytilinidion resinicola TaxID=574789 RepID=A0A6A6YUW6_9PEZI|nr:uncharacterized protein BDZ99DRAFT_383847 [Mytilinidion resinicola]KAF2812173.1 hypothetical protein BDZ99DRAFT_383847 [Mytilinidion resinicola]